MLVVDVSGSGRGDMPTGNKRHNSRSDDNAHITVVTMFVCLFVRVCACVRVCVCVCVCVCV